MTRGNEVHARQSQQWRIGDRLQRITRAEVCVRSAVDEAL